MQIYFRKLAPDDVEILTSWRYEAPYDIYNLAFPPDQDDVEYWLDPVNRGHAMLDESGEMVAFCSFGPDGQVPGGDYAAEALDIGMGMLPDLTGQGLGKLFAQSVIDYAMRQYSPRALRVTIATFNQRAVRVWQMCGFRHVQTFCSTHNRMEFTIFSKNTS